MIKEFKYRPPLKYLFIGISSLGVSMIFVLPIGKITIWFSIIMGFFGLMTFTMGITFLIIFIRKFNVGNLIIGSDFVEIPGRWKNRTRLKFDDIESMGEFDTYDHVIEIRTKDGGRLIEKQWMKKQDFYEVRKRLKEYWENE